MVACKQPHDKPADERLSQGPLALRPYQTEALKMLDAARTPFSLALLTATKGNASKRLVPDGNGHPIKDPEHRLGISAGRVEHIRLAGLAGLRDLLARIQPNQALVHGIPNKSTPGTRYKLVVAERYTGAPGTIARTLDCFAYPPGARLLMLDYDPDPQATHRLTGPQELMALKRCSGVGERLTRSRAGRRSSRHAT